MSFQFYNDLIERINDYSLKIDNNIVSGNDLHYLHKILIDIPDNGGYHFNSSKINTPSIKDKISKIIKYVSKEKLIKSNIFNKIITKFITKTPEILNDFFSCIKNQILLDNFVYITYERQYSKLISNNIENGIELLTLIILRDNFVTYKNLITYILSYNNNNFNKKMFKMFNSNILTDEIKITLFILLINNNTKNDCYYYILHIKQHINDLYFNINDKIKRNDLYIILLHLFKIDYINFKDIIDDIYKNNHYIDFSVKKLKELISFFSINRNNINIFIKLNNIEIDKELLKYLIYKKIKVEHNIPIDEELLLCCSINHFIPYKIDCIPTDEIVSEVCKYNDMNNVKKIIEAGGKLEHKHLLYACNLYENGNIIKYLIDHTKPDMQILDRLLERYNAKIYLNVINTEFYKKDEKIVEFNEELLFKIEKNENDIDNNKKYLIKSKIRNLLNIKKTKKYNINELLVLFINYLENNRLIIQNYFILNEELSEIIKTDVNRVLNVSEIKNFVSYFIKLD
jgi:hypothetical protein